jgi:hypothetical protein
MSPKLLTECFRVPGVGGGLVYKSAILLKTQRNNRSSYVGGPEHSLLRLTAFISRRAMIACVAILFFR